jgi:hypothetical protein
VTGAEKDYVVGFEFGEDVSLRGAVKLGVGCLGVLIDDNYRRNE